MTTETNNTQSSTEAAAQNNTTTRDATWGEAVGVFHELGKNGGYKNLAINFGVTAGVGLLAGLAISFFSDDK